MSRETNKTKQKQKQQNEQKYKHLYTQKCSNESTTVTPCGSKFSLINKLILVN